MVEKNKLFSNYLDTSLKPKVQDFLYAIERLDKIKKEPRPQGGRTEVFYNTNNIFELLARHDFVNEAIQYAINMSVRDSGFLEIGEALIEKGQINSVISLFDSMICEEEREELLKNLSYQLIQLGQYSKCVELVDTLENLRPIDKATFMLKTATQFYDDDMPLCSFHCFMAIPPQWEQKSDNKVSRIYFEIKDKLILFLKEKFEKMEPLSFITEALETLKKL